MAERLVINTGPLIALSRIGCLDIVGLMPEEAALGTVAEALKLPGFDCTKVLDWMRVALLHFRTCFA